MKFGLCLPIRRDCSLEFNIDLAIRAEMLGFDSVWVSDHVIMPSNMKKTFSSVFYDPFVLLTAIGANTKNIKIGTSVIVLPYRHPVVVAKMVSTLDIMSKGRVVFGVASGWLKEEFDTLNANFDKRGKITDEYLQSILTLWQNDDPVFKGDFVNFSDIDFYPKPYNNRMPEVWVGGSSHFAIDRALKYGTGWQPTWISPRDMCKLKQYLLGKSDDMNINMKNFTFSVRNRVSFKKTQSNTIYTFYGDMDNISKEVEAFKSAGVDHIVFDPDTKNDLETIQMIEELSEGIIKKFN